MAALLLSARAARAEKAPVQVQPRVTFTFGKEIRFEARFDPADEVKEATIFYRPEWQQGETFTGSLVFARDGAAVFTHDMQQTPLPPFVNIFYWFRVTLKDGTAYTTPSFSFVLEDNRFQWQSMENPPFRVYWYKGSTAFAQSILDAAAQGLMQAQELWAAAPPQDTVAIYVYADAQTLQSALGAEGWVAGHASPAYHALFVALADTPQQASDIRRLVPHELAHYLLYQQTGPAGYRSLPMWLNEGLASANERSPNPDYPIVLKEALENHRLIPIKGLCYGFPVDASGALLAYAESASFTNYLLHRYGRSTLRALITAYADGMDCEAGAEQVLHESLYRLDRDWQAETFNVGKWSQLFRHMLPWLVLLLVLLLSLAAGAWVISLQGSKG